MKQISIGKVVLSRNNFQDMSKVFIILVRVTYVFSSSLCCLHAFQP